MNYLVILSGGVGARMMSERPKQYIEINKKPIIQYTIECFDFTLFKKIIIVVADNWKDYVRNIVNNNFDKQLFDYEYTQLMNDFAYNDGVIRIINSPYGDGTLISKRWVDGNAKLDLMFLTCKYEAYNGNLLNRINYKYFFLVRIEKMGSHYIIYWSGMSL